MLGHESLEGLAHGVVPSDVSVEGIAMVVAAHHRLVSMSTSQVKSFPRVLAQVLLPELLHIGVVELVLVLLSLRLALEVSDHAVFFIRLVLSLQKRLAIFGRVRRISTTPLERL